MKRLLAMLLTVAMLAAMLCGCASEGTKETQQTQQPQATEAAAEENVIEAQKPATATGTPKEIVETLVGDILDLSSYEVDAEEDYILYYNYDQYGSFPYEIDIYGMKFQINGVTTCQDLVDAGWGTNMRETADALTGYLGHFTGPEGESFFGSVVNVKDEAVASGETFLTSVTGEIPDCGNFTFGSITENSTISDVINAIGNPRCISYSEISGLKMEFADENINSVNFDFDQDGVMTKVNLSYNYYYNMT